MRFIAGKNPAAVLFQAANILGNLAGAGALLIFAYLGSFSRYLADDYCLSVFLMQANPLQATIKSYIVWSDRYSNLFLIQLIEWGGKWGVQLMSAGALLLWTIGLTWLLSEIGKSARLQWKPGIHSWVAGLLICLTLIEAPNLYQVLYWQAGLVTYLAPLVIYVFVAAFFLWQVRTAFRTFRLFGTGLVCFGLIFLAGGSSETTSALVISVLTIAVLAVYLRRELTRRREILMLLGISLASAVLSMAVMALAPGNGVRLTTPTSNLLVLLRETAVYTAQFMWLTLRTLPLPCAISLIVPFLVISLLDTQDKVTRPQIPGPALWRAAAIIAVSLFISIAFSFAPSAFAQSYPVDRARFPAYFLMSLGLAAEGGILAFLAGKIRAPFQTAFIKSAAGLGLCLLALYPLRAVYKFYSAAEPEYRSWAVAWDARQARILADKSNGLMVQVVPRLPGMGYIKELDFRPDYWVNRCAEKFYGIESIKAIRFDP